MTHYTDPLFWERYNNLPIEIQLIADKNYELLKADPQHHSLQFKRVGRFWSVRVGIGYRAVGLAKDDNVLWFWIGPYAEYDKILARR